MAWIRFEMKISLFKEYVSTLCYKLENVDTKEVVCLQNLFTVTSADHEICVTFPQEMPFGKYVMTTWGNLKTEDAFESGTYLMHGKNQPEDDVYLTCDTLVYDELRYQYLVEMERVTGKLIIEANNLPGVVKYSDKKITNLFGSVESDFNYSLNTWVKTRTIWDRPVNIVTHTILAPSVKAGTSLLKLKFYDREDGALDGIGSCLTPDNVNITMARNMLTILRYTYEGCGQFKMYILINDNWEDLHSMEIE